MNPTTQRSSVRKKQTLTQLVKPPKTINYSVAILVVFSLQLVSDLVVQVQGTKLTTLDVSHRKGYAFLSFLSPFLIVMAPFRTKLLHLRAPAIAL